MDKLVKALTQDVIVTWDHISSFKQSSCFDIFRSVLTPTHKNNEQLQYIATWILLNLASLPTDKCEIFVTEGIVFRLVDSMQYVSDGRTLSNIFWALSNMCVGNPIVRDEMTKCDISDALHSMINNSNLRIEGEEFYDLLVDLLKIYTQVTPSLNLSAY